MSMKDTRQISDHLEVVKWKPNEYEQTYNTTLKECIRFDPTFF